MTMEFYQDFHSSPNSSELRLFLSAATRQAHEAGRPIKLQTVNWKDLAEFHRSTRVSRKTEKALRYVAARCRHPGIVSRIDFDLDFPVSDCGHSVEFREYVEYLIENKMLREYSAEGSETVCGYSPTIAGWQAIEPTLAGGGTPGICFVAMWFDQSMDNAYDLGFFPAIENDCGFKANRIDKKPHNNQITDEIMAGIRDAQFMVADFTSHRPSVYYEAGFARGLGRDVIYCCEKVSFDIDRQFDTSVISHVIWNDPEDLRKKLADRIRATILPKA